jgi:hypothetical protein
MLNLEYARLVDADRRRVADERIRTDRLLHPDQPTVEATVATPPAGRRPRAACRGVPGPVR